MRSLQGIKVVIVLVLAVALAVVGCAKPPPGPVTTPTPTSTPTPAPTTTPTPTPKPTPAPAPTGPTGQLRIALFTLGDEQFNVFISGLSTDVQNTLSPMFDFLLRAEGGKLTPGIAESWELGSDGRSWIFHIRKGVKFHNGEDLKADDVKFTIDLYRGDKMPIPDTRRMIKSVDVVDDYTVRANTDGPQPFYPNIAAPGARGHSLIHPKDYIEKNGMDYFSRHPIGSGPYKFSRHVIGDLMEYEAVDTHWRKVPAFKKLTLLKIPEENTRIAMLKTGEVDVSESTIESSLELDRGGFKTAQTTAEQAAVLLTGVYQPEGAKFPTSNIKVRQALSLAINRSEIINTLWYGKALPAGPFPVHVVSADIDIPFWMDYQAKTGGRYDLEEAKRLLKEAGYPNGFNIKLWQVNWTGSPYMPKMAEVVQAYWGKIGVKAEITPVDMSVYSTNRRTLQTPEWIGAAFTMATSPNPAVPERINSHFHSTTHTPLFGKAFPEVDKEIEQALSEPDLAKRKALEDDLIKRIVDSYVSIMIARVPALVAMGSKVDFEIPPPPTIAPFGYYIDTAKYRK